MTISRTTTRMEWDEQGVWCSERGIYCRQHKHWLNQKQQQRKQQRTLRLQHSSHRSLLFLPNLPLRLSLRQLKLRVCSARACLVKAVLQARILRLVPRRVPCRLARGRPSLAIAVLEVGSVVLPLFDPP